MTNSFIAENAYEYVRDKVANADQDELNGLEEDIDASKVTAEFFIHLVIYVVLPTD